jgi:polyferredoxin
VDCNQCVLVCPTGIDIRQGSQLECLGCMRCVDACDKTMEARGFPKDLVRYASLDTLEGRKAPLVSGRLMVYGLLSLCLFSASAALLASRAPLGIDVVRRGSSPYEVLAEGPVRNTYTVHIRNRLGVRTALAAAIEIPGLPSALAATVATSWDARGFAVSGGQLLTLPLEVTVPAEAFRMGRAEARLVITGKGGRQSVPLVLAGPWRRNG